MHPGAASLQRQLALTPPPSHAAEEVPPRPRRAALGDIGPRPLGLMRRVRARTKLKNSWNGPPPSDRSFARFGGRRRVDKLRARPFACDALMLSLSKERASLLIAAQALRILGAAQHEQALFAEEIRP